MSKIYFIERRLNKGRIKHLKSIAEKSDLFCICEHWCDASYLIASDSTAEEAIAFLTKGINHTDEDKQDLTLLNVIDISWFYKCVKTKLLQNTDSYQLLYKNKRTSNEIKSNIDTSVSTISSEIPNKKLCLKEVEVSTIAKYACQTAAPLMHYNNKFCEALEVLEMHALFRGDKNSEVRALAFRRGSASLKAHHKQIVCEDDLLNVPYINLNNSTKAGHCKKVILDLLSEGYSEEVESVQNSDFFKTMKKFCGIFGVGPVTARKWFYDHQYRTLNDLMVAKVQLTPDQKVGLVYYDDLNAGVTLDEANVILSLVRKTLLTFDNSITVTLTGGFRRGKSEGHDVDLLLTQPSQSKKNLIEYVIEQLKDNFLYTDKKMMYSQNIRSLTKESNGHTMDRFDKCFSIFKFNNQWLNQPTCKDKNWKAVRLDLVVVPEDQFPFALLGWTGSKHFEREIRRYAKNEKKIFLTSHGMFYIDTKKSISVSSEEEIFEKLNLKFRKPNERCF